MLEDYFFTKNTRWVLWGAFAVVVALLIFHAGVVVGSHKSMRERPPQGAGLGGMFGFMPPQGFVENGHGAVGTIATVTLPTFTLQTRDGLTERVETGSSTDVTGGTTGTLGDLQSGQTVIIIGNPQTIDDQDDLDARMIHILR
jgi:hypothetical protein